MCARMPYKVYQRIELVSLVFVRDIQSMRDTWTEVVRKSTEGSNYTYCESVLNKCYLQGTSIAAHHLFSVLWWGIG
jgi:hypothetical protein